MSYIKHTWIDNEVVSAENFNNIENGILNCDSEPYIVNIISLKEVSGYTYWFTDKTNKEIINAFLNGNKIIFSAIYANELNNREIIGIANEGGMYFFYLLPYRKASTANNYSLISNVLDDQCVLMQYTGGGVR